MLHEPRNGYLEKDVTSRLLPNFFTDDWRDDCGGNVAAERSWNPLEPPRYPAGPGFYNPLEPPRGWNENQTGDRTPSPLKRLDWAETVVTNSGRGRMEVPDVGIIGQGVSADRRGQGSPGAIGAQLLRSIQNHQEHSAKEPSAAPYRPGELLGKLAMPETSDGQHPTNSATSYDMKGQKAGAEALCEASPDERDDDDDDDDDDYSDSEDADDQRPVPPGKVDGQQLNVGSTGHHLRLCKPCAFWNTKGCKDGKECKFCHLCEPGEKKRRKKEKSAYIRNISRWRQSDPPTPPGRASGPPGPPIGGSPGPSLVTGPRR